MMVWREERGEHHNRKLNKMRNIPLNYYVERERAVVATDAVRLLLVVTVELQLELLLIKYWVSWVMMVQPG